MLSLLWPKAHAFSPQIFQELLILRVSMTIHSMALHHIVVSLSPHQADLRPSMEAELYIMLHI